MTQLTGKKVEDKGDLDLEADEADLKAVIVIEIKSIILIIIERKRITMIDIDQEEKKVIRALHQKVEKEIFQMILNKCRN